MPRQQRDHEPDDVGRFLREHSLQILDAWERHARDAGALGHGVRASTRADAATLLDRISARMQARELDPSAAAEDRRAKVLRVEPGELRETIRQLCVLRESIARVWADHAMPGPSPPAAMQRAIDDAIRDAVDRSMVANERDWHAVDRMASAPLGPRELDELLRDLLAVLRETTTSVDAAVILLREGDTLRARAAVGVERPLQDWTAVIGEGFAGRVAEQHEAMALDDAADEPGGSAEVIGRADLHAIYGMPLCAADEIVGVALLGSRERGPFATQDRRVFSALEQRATIAIGCHKLREAARAAHTMGLVSTVGAALATSLDVEATLAKIASLVAPAVADWCIVDVLEDDGTLRRVSQAPTGAPVFMAHEHHEKDVGDIPGSPMWVVRTGEPAFVATIDDAMLVAAARSDAHLQALRSLGLVSYIAVPLAARERTLGVITMATAESGRRFDAHDLQFAHELARVSAFAFDNARLYEEAQRATKWREEVIAIVSHDLRNPLYAINLAGTLLQRRLLAPEGDERVRKQVDTILRSAARMEHLIRSLLDVASIQAGRLVIEPQVCDADALVADAVDTQRPIAAAKGVVLRRAERVEGGGAVRCDPDRILQVLSNIVDNAVKFCRPGDTIVVDSRIRGRELEVVVADTGPGIAPEALPRLFDPYWSAPQNVRRGTGLGLYIARSIVVAHHGRMSVESELGRGTRFVFTLPRA